MEKVAIKIKDEDQELAFICENELTLFRAKTIYTKEPGTIEWIRDTFHAGDVFYDIGANVGIYSLFAWKYIADLGHIYSFEPHPGNISALMQNIIRNKMQDDITVIPCGLSNSEGFKPFHIHSLDTGSSGSQIDDAISSHDFESAVTTLAMVTTIDSLIESNIIKPANLVKIDVDGQELKILQGMSKLLASETAPRSMQVEMDPRTREEIEVFMKGFGYELTHRHYTYQGQKLLDQGTESASIIYNQIFSKQ